MPHPLGLEFLPNYNPSHFNSKVSGLGKHHHGPYMSTLLLIHLNQRAWGHTHVIVVLALLHCAQFIQTKGSIPHMCHHNPNSLDYPQVQCNLEIPRAQTYDTYQVVLF